ncbi:MAG: DUF7507 domain-containing protein [Thermogutta sp.]
MEKWVEHKIWRKYLLSAGILAGVLLPAAGCVAPATNQPPGGAVLPSGGDFGEYYREVPGPVFPGDCSEFMVTPQETAAAVGSEVILVASVRGQDQYMLTNQRVEWTITPGGVGNFVDFRRANFMDYLLGDFTRPRKITEHYVITSTSREYLRLTRGTVAPNDDVVIRPGQAWVSVASPVEGTTAVNVYVPCVHSWDRRLQTVFIHWVDAQWTLPPPAIIPAGSRHQLTTTVTRMRDRSPCAGWKVRYEIIGGVSALLGPSGTSSVEVPVDSAGQATAEIYQTQPLGGSTQVAVQIVRPADAPGAAGKQLTVGSGQTLITWSAAQLAVRVNAPSQVAVGETATVRIEVKNPGDLPAENVFVSMALPSGVTQQSSTPPASVSGTTLSWTLGRLSPHEMRTLDLAARFAQSGTYTLCAEAQAAGNLRSHHCGTVGVGTAVAQGQLELRVQGPERAAVGQEITYVIQITNRGTTPLANLLVRDTFDAGLQHAVGQRAVERDLPGTLQPGETKTIGVIFRVVQPGRWCHTVQISGPSGVSASQTVCLQAEAAGSTTTPTPAAPTLPSTAPPSPDTGVPSAGATSEPSSSLPTTPGLPPPRFGTGTPMGSSPGAAIDVPQAPSFGGTATTPSPPSPGTAVATSPVTLRLTGPTQARLGESATFTMEIVNIGNQAITNAQLRCNFDVSWEPLRASAGYLLEGETIIWTLASVEPNQTLRRQVELRAVGASPQACCRAELVSATGPLAREQACTRIESGAPAATIRERPAGLGEPFAEARTDSATADDFAQDSPGGHPSGHPGAATAHEKPRNSALTPSPVSGSLEQRLKVWVIDRHEPIAVAKEKRVTFVVQNSGNDAVHGLSVKIYVPPQFRVALDQTEGPSGKPTLIGQTLEFAPLSKLNPSETVSFVIGIKADSPGQVRLLAEVTCEGARSPIEVERTTTIVGR